MKTIHTLALLPALWLCGVTLNRGETTPPPAPVVTVYARMGCQPCRRLHADVRGNTDYDWQFHYEKNHPKWVTSYPFVVWTGRDGKRYFVSGWEDFETWEAAYRRTQ